MGSRFRRFSNSLVLAVLALLTLNGCQAQSVDVSGRVTMAGKPVVGSVALFPASGSPVVVTLDADGRYSARDVPGGGEIRIAVYSPDPKEELQTLPTGPEGDKDRAAVNELRKRWTPIPSRYNDPGQSGLSFMPSGPSSTFDIDVQPK